MMQLVMRREAQNKRNAQAIADIEDLAFKVVSAEEKARQEAERQKDFSPIPEKKKKRRNFKLSSAKKQDSDYDDVVSSVQASPPPASKKSEVSPQSLGKIKMKRPEIDNSVTRMQDETTDNFKLRPEKVDEEQVDREKSKSAVNDTSTPKIALRSNNFDAKAQTDYQRREDDLTYSASEAQTDRRRP